MSRKVSFLAILILLMLTTFVATAVGDDGTSAEQTTSLWVSVQKLIGSQPLLLLFLILALGMGLGAIRVFGLSLGASGVLFSALLLGAFGRNTDWALPNGIGTLGLVLFVYAVGIGAGQTFFRAFRDQGRQLVTISLITVACAAGGTYLLGRLFGLPADLSAGVFAGAMTSTPGLASAMEAATSANLETAAVSIGYGLAYPVGVIITVLYVQLLPRLLRANLEELGLQKPKNGKRGINRQLVEISNPNVFGKKLQDLKALQKSHVQVTRVLDGGQLRPITSTHVLEQGQTVLLVADEENLELLTMVLGKASDASVVIDADRDRVDIVITHPSLLGKTLRDLHLRTKYGVTISRVERLGLSFVPSADTVLNMADRIICVGPPEGLKELVAAAGHRPRKLHETDLMSLGIGLTLGVLLGMLPIPIPGMGSFTLGLAGGPLLVGMLFAHFRNFLGIVGYMPQSARMFTQEFGLVLFLAEAGFTSGAHLLEMARQFGAAPFLAAAAIAVIAITAAHLSARYLFKMDLLETLGGACGAMTSTAGVGAVTSKTDSDAPVTSYAAAYPAALVLMTLFVRVLIGLTW